MTDSDFSMLTDTEPPLSTLQLILQELQSINNKMDSVETAATRRQQEVVNREQDAFELGCERGRKDERGEFDEPDGLPEFGPHAPPYQEPVSVLDHRTEGALQENEARARLDASVLRPRNAPEEVQVTKVQDLSTGRSRECRVPVAKGDRIVVNTDTLEVKAENEPPAKDQTGFQFKEAYREFRQLYEDCDECPMVEALELLSQARVLIRKKHFKLEASLKREKKLKASTGLQDPSKFKPADGDKFLIQYRVGLSTRVESSFYDAEEKWFSTNDDIYRLFEIDAMMPFPEPVKVDRSGK
jgi:hypothetical protein